MLSWLTKMKRRSKGFKGKNEFPDVKYSGLYQIENPGLIQKYWPCFAILSCAVIFSIVFYSTIYFGEDELYPECIIPDTFLKTDITDTPFLTYLYHRDTSQDNSLLYTDDTNVCCVKDILYIIY